MKHRLLIWYGELTTQAQLLKRGFFFLSSGMLWLLVFLVLPGLVLVVVSFATRGAYGQLVWEFTIENYKRLMGFSLFGWTSDYLLILWRSVVVALVTTLVSILLSYPLCFFIAAREERSRYMWLTLVIIPFWTNMVIQNLCLVFDFGTGTSICQAGRRAGIYQRGGTSLSECLRGLYRYGFHVFTFCHLAAVR